MPTVNHTYDLSNKQSKKKRNTHGTSWNRSWTQAYADTFDIPRALLMSKHLPKTLLFHMTSSQRKTSPVHVTTSQQLLCTWTHHRECILNAFNKFSHRFVRRKFLLLTSYQHIHWHLHHPHELLSERKLFFYNASALKNTFHNLQRTHGVYAQDLEKRNRTTRLDLLKHYLG
jgi:hypothetical protein